MEYVCFVCGRVWTSLSFNIKVVDLYISVSEKYSNSSTIVVRIGHGYSYEWKVQQLTHYTVIESVEDSVMARELTNPMSATHPL